MSLLTYSAKSLKEICFDYVKKLCSIEEIYNWTECSLFSLPFKIYNHIKTNKFYYCTSTELVNRFCVTKNVLSRTTQEFFIFISVKLKEIVAD